MTKRMTTFLFTLLLLIGMTTTMTQAQGSGVELVMGGATTTYATFDEAVAAFNTSAETDGTINLVGGQTYASMGYNLIGKNLIVNGNGATLNVVGDTTSPQYLVMTANGFATYNQIILNVWSTIARTQAFVIGSNTHSNNATVTLNNSTLTVNGGGVVKDGIAYQGKANTIFNVNASSIVLTTGNTRSGVFTETEATKQLNITDSTFESIDNPGSGIVSGTGKFTGTVTNSNVNVNNNGSYGSNGGNWFVTNNSTMNVNENGGHGFSVTTLAITNSTVHGDRNGYQGIHSTGLFTVQGSVVSASFNAAALGNSAGLYLGNANHTVDATSSLTLNGNSGPGLHVNATGGSLTIAQGAIVEIIDNRAQAVEAYRSGGGIFVRNGSVVVPTDAAIYNNRAVVAGDDIFVNVGSITFGPATAAILNEAPDPVNHQITGWFMDEAVERWNVHDVSRDEHAVEVAPGTYPAGAAFKAAHHNKVNENGLSSPKKVPVNSPLALVILIGLMGLVALRARRSFS